MPLDLVALRPAYNGSALAASAAVAAPYWAHALAAIGAEGDGSGPLAVTLAALLAAAAADRFIWYRDRHGQRHDLWIPRVAVFTTALGPLYNPHTGSLMLNFLTGSAS